MYRFIHLLKLQNVSNILVLVNYLLLCINYYYFDFRSALLYENMVHHNNVYIIYIPLQYAGDSQT